MERSVDGKFERSVPRKKNRAMRIKLSERNYFLYRYWNRNVPRDFYWQNMHQ